MKTNKISITKYPIQEGKEIFDKLSTKKQRLLMAAEKDRRLHNLDFPKDKKPVPDDPLSKYVAHRFSILSQFVFGIKNLSKK